jgi:hypothetical protein
MLLLSLCICVQFASALTRPVIVQYRAALELGRVTDVGGHAIRIPVFSNDAIPSHKVTPVHYPTNQTSSVTVHPVTYCAPLYGAVADSLSPVTVLHLGQLRRSPRGGPYSSPPMIIQYAAAKRSPQKQWGWLAPIARATRNSRWSYP